MSDLATAMNFLKADETGEKCFEWNLEEGYTFPTYKQLFSYTLEELQMIKKIQFSFFGVSDRIVVATKSKSKYVSELLLAFKETEAVFINNAPRSPLYRLSPKQIQTYDSFCLKEEEEEEANEKVFFVGLADQPGIDLSIKCYLSTLSGDNLKSKIYLVSRQGDVTELPGSPDFKDLHWIYLMGAGRIKRGKYWLDYFLTENSYRFTFTTGMGKDNQSPQTSYHVSLVYKFALDVFLAVTPIKQTPRTDITHSSYCHSEEDAYVFCQALQMVCLISKKMNRFVADPVQFIDDHYPIL